MGKGKRASKEKIQTQCHGIELNPSKNRAMHRRNNSSFQDEFIKSR
jgi:hypothetical protein